MLKLESLRIVSAALLLSTIAIAPALARCGWRSPPSATAPSRRMSALSSAGRRSPRLSAAMASFAFDLIFFLAIAFELFLLWAF